MSAQSVREEIRIFLGRNDAEVLCLRGKWGVGKTHMWETELKAAHAERRIALTRYSYVSLFGLNSLEDLRLTIFQNVITLSDGLKKADLATLDAFVSKHVNLRKLSAIAARLPIINRFVGPDVANIVAGMAVRDQIVCVDDFERRGKNLNVADVLGLLSDLKEQRDCKIVLILNDERLATEKDDFDRDVEKIVDVSMLYAPSPTEAALIAIPEPDAVSEEIRGKCSALGITNIRVIRRAARKARAVAEMLAPYDEAVLKAVLPSIVLFSWANDQPDDAPSLKFLERKSASQFGMEPGEDAHPEEAAWNSLLESYGYMWTDDLDLLLMKSIKEGHFDADVLDPAFEAANEKALVEKAGGSFEAAWDGFHNSFADNTEEVLSSIHAVFMRSVRYITPINLNGTIRLFKDLGLDDKAREMLAFYIAERGDTPDLFDLSRHPFSGDITDADVRAAFARSFEKTQQAEIVDVARLLMTTRPGWTEEQLASLNAASVDEYVSAFKSHTGNDLRDILASALQSDRISNATPMMKRVAELARQALTVIGTESTINALRVRRFGVDVPSFAVASTAAPVDE